MFLPKLILAIINVLAYPFEGAFSELRNLLIHITS